MVDHKMNPIKRWFQRKNTSSQATAENTEPQQVNSKLVNSKLINSSTHVTVEELIQLQQQARKIDMTRRSYAKASSTGAHRSRFRGRGMDYQESRIYQAGDDIRNMDWRVTARSGKPHTKLYQEERERPVVFLVDFNPSMFFGSTHALKSVVAAKAAALIAWSVASKGDRIGALIINQTHHELPPKMGKRGALQLIRELVNHSDPQKVLSATHHHENLDDELKRLRKIARPGSLVFLISDFYSLSDETAHHLRSLSRHCDIQAIQIVDPLEISPPPPEQYYVSNGSRDAASNTTSDTTSDTNNTQVAVLDTRSKTGREQYQNFFDQHHQQIKRLMRQQKIPLFQLSTSDDLLLKIQQNLGQSRQRSSATARKVVS